MTRFRYDIATEGQEEIFGPSKTRVKNEMQSLQDLGLALADLPAERLARIDMPEALREAFTEMARLKSHEARRRQAQFIGKILRDMDVTPFEEALSVWRQGKAQAARGFPDLARWRDRLLAENDALTAWCALHPLTDTRRLRTLLRNARQEETAAAEEATLTGALTDTPATKGRHYRALFQELKTIAEAQQATD
jgi:ribosome-associated protein